jgi:hypothetical protein
MRRLFWDIETSPNIGFFWRPGYRLSIHADNIIHERAIICISYKWEHEKKVHTLEWDKGDDRALVEAFAPIMEEADELVAHNGDKFDLKWYNGRHLKHGLPPLPIAKTVDTLVIARRRFMLNSNRLDYIAKFLGLGGKHSTSFDLWKDIVLDNCPKAMKTMTKYCEQDVKLLEKVYHLLNAYHSPKTHVGVEAGKDRWSCASCGSEKVHKSKTKYTAAGTVQHQMQCNDCGKYHTINNAAFNRYTEAKA